MQSSLSIKPLPHVAIIDNYDSFTYNLVHLIEKITAQPVSVFLNDVVDINTLAEFDKIILSPGPGLPQQAGKLLDIIQHYAATKNILGVCLGHQAIGMSFGGKLQNLSTVYHGIASKIIVNDSEQNNQHSIFKNLPNEFDAGRYHSWVIDKASLPNEFLVTATDGQGNIMAMQHRSLPLYGIQFHPESIMTEQGEAILRNWLSI